MRSHLWIPFVGMGGILLGVALGLDEPVTQVLALAVGLALLFTGVETWRRESGKAS